MRKIIIIILLFLIASPVFAYYNPGTPLGFVSDFANVIDKAAERQIEDKLIAFEKETSNEMPLKEGVASHNVLASFIREVSDLIEDRKNLKEQISKLEHENGELRQSLMRLKVIFAEAQTLSR